MKSNRRWHTGLQWLLLGLGLAFTTLAAPARLIPPANQAIDLVLHGTGGDADVDLFAPGTTNVTSDPWATRSVQEGNDELIQGTLLIGGDWFVDVYAFSGASEYSLVVNLAGTEVASAQTMTVTIGDPMAGSRSGK